MTASSDTELLKLKTDFLLDSYKEKPDSFYNLRNEWITFLFENKELNKLLIKLILQNKIDKLWLKKIFSYYSIIKVAERQDRNNTKIIKPEEIPIPDFICIETEKETDYLHNDIENIGNYAKAFKDEQLESLPMEVRIQTCFNELKKSNLKIDKNKTDVEKEIDRNCEYIARELNKHITKQELFFIKKLTNDLVFEEKIVSASVKDDKIIILDVLNKVEETKSLKNKKIKAFIVIANQKGYIKLYKNAPKIIIGGIGTRKFKLIKVLIEPAEAINAPKKIDGIFEHIKISKDNQNQLLEDYSTQSNEQLKIIQNTIKEIQKIKKLQGKITFDFSPNKKTLRIVFT